MEYAIVFLPLIGSLIGYLGRSLTKYFAKDLPKYPINEPKSGKNKIAYSI